MSAEHPTYADLQEPVYRAFSDAFDALSQYLEQTASGRYDSEGLMRFRLDVKEMVGRWME